MKSYGAIPNTRGPVDLAIETAEALEKAANAFLKIEIATDEQAAKAVDHDTQLLRAWQANETARKAEQAPHQQAIADSQKVWNPVQHRLQICRDLIKAKLRTFQAAKQLRIDAERAEAARKAAEARRQAEEAARRAEAPKTVDDIARAQEAAEAAAAAEKAAEAIPERAQVRGALSGRATSLRAHWTATIEDIDEVFVHFRNHPDLRECLTKLANADLRAQDGEERSVPGCKCVKELR